MPPQQGSPCRGRHQHGAGEAVAVDNASTPTLCAEIGNVDVRLSSTRVRRFTVAAGHPAYAGTLAADRTAPDFRGCEMSGDPVHRAKPRDVTLFETGRFRLTGFAFSSFWRPAAVPVRTGGRVELGLHLLQLHVKSNGRTIEVLVLYPPDGCWRARPPPPAHLATSAYGSSFLIGPVETAGPRPFVDIGVDVDSETGTFRLAFARGGAATRRRSPSTPTTSSSTSASRTPSLDGRSRRCARCS